MRRIRYAVAASLDGYIAGPNGEYDWIIQDPEIDFRATFAEFDTLLMGRGTFEPMSKGGGGGTFGLKVVVVSRTLRQSDYPRVTILGEGWEEKVAAMKAEEGKDIWLFGGGLLFRSCLDAGLVDTVEVAVIPVLLGGGIPLLPSTVQQTRLELTGHRIYNNTGIVRLEYAIRPTQPKKAKAPRRPAKKQGSGR